MFHKTLILSIALLMLTSLYAQTAQKEKKIKDLDFCGAVYNNMSLIRSKFKEQLSFLRINQNDTIVDIGAQSGVFEGALSTLQNLANVHFILVDIDSTCLNSKKLAAVTKHYSIVKPGTIPPNHTIINNTPDSLWLPKEQYNKVWILNTLHEVPNQEQFVLDVNQIVRKKGEVVILEMIPAYPGQLHGGCKKPLRSLNDWISVFDTAGLVYQEKLDIIQRGKVRLHMIRFTKQ